MFARVLQGVLAVIIVTVLVIAALQLRRTSLLYVEPPSLAGLGTLVADWTSENVSMLRRKPSLA